jgi:polyphosphate:AMP phosphotransferase
MLEKIDLTRTIDKEEAKNELEKMGMRLSELQRECKAEQIPVMVVFEGIGAAGKGVQINKLIRYLDPRGFHVHATKGNTEEEEMRPFLWRYWCKIPEQGRITIFDQSWYTRVLGDRFHKKIPQKQVPAVFEDIRFFEKQLTDDGMVIIKFYLYISKKEQKKRYDKLLASRETAWRVTEDDLKRNKHYDEYLQINEEMLETTDYEYAPWTIVEATSKDYAAVKIMDTMVRRLEEALREKKAKKTTAKPMKVSGHYRTKVLSGVDLSKTMEYDEYRQKLEELQKRLEILHSEIYRRRIPVVIAFEGWDAGGKGGAIKRLTANLDPRGYAVYPTSSPNDIEKKHHYLWRFWKNMPKAGHIAIFDRTWYGRVMVERVEGFCTENEWKRAYREINEMESHLCNSGALVLKFWLHIDKDEQEKRFNERTNTPEKQWKITDEDWRNRSKWDAYEECVDEMLLKTSTLYAPWIVVEANSKYYARIKVLQSVVDAIEERLEKEDKQK